MATGAAKKTVDLGVNTDWYFIVQTLSKKNIRVRRSGRVVPADSTLVELLQFRTRALEQLMDLTDAELRRSKHYVEKKLRDPQIVREGLEDVYLEEVWSNEDLCVETEQLAIVGLYSKVELTLRTILLWSYAQDVTKDRLYNWRNLKQRLALDFKLDLMALRGSKTTNELRCLANSIKHEARVNKELGAIGPWREGRKIGKVRRHFGRMRNASTTFIRSLTNRLDRELRRLRPPTPTPTDDTSADGLFPTHT